MDTLKPAAHANEPFKGLNVSDEVLRGASFSDCTFTQCRFHNVDFTGVTFTDCVFDHTEISLPKLTNCGLHGVAFHGCKLVGADFSRCSTQFLNVSFKDTLIDTCNFSLLKLIRTPFLHCTIRESRFVSTNLTEADFDGSDLEGTIFNQCDLQKARFHNAKHYSIDPSTNRVKGATFSLPDAFSLLSGLGIELK